MEHSVKGTWSRLCECRETLCQEDHCQENHCQEKCVRNESLPKNARRAAPHRLVSHTSSLPAAQSHTPAALHTVRARTVQPPVFVFCLFFMSKNPPKKIGERCAPLGEGVAGRVPRKLVEGQVELHLRLRHLGVVDAQLRACMTSCHFWQQTNYNTKVTSPRSASK